MIEGVSTAQLNANKSGLEWAARYLKNNQYDRTRKALIENRIKLKRIKYAASVNPAAAIFGESQVGKSYMVDSILTSETSILNVYDGNGVPTGFIESINPMGGGKEATSLISRFTAKKMWINKDYPIKVTMLSPVDLVSILIDTYYNDVTRHELPKGDVVVEEIERILATYGSRSAPLQQTITEDDIYELKEYTESYLLSRGEAFRSSLLEKRYFEQLSSVIDKVGVNEWADVFSFLWNKNSDLTDVFVRLIKTLETLNFNRTVYVKLDAVLRQPGTILDVDRIYEFFDITEITSKGETIKIKKALVPDMSVLIDGEREVAGIRKTEFCALAMELAFCVVDPNATEHPILEEKKFLKNLDILDFPGARSRLEIPQNSINKEEACNMLLRGKIAYLFNKYSQQYLISNLLFCHHDAQSNVNTLSALLQGWVENTVGKTPEMRVNFMKAAEIPPLFIIGTKFNKDFDFEPKYYDDPDEYISAKLDTRMQNLIRVIHPSENNKWFDEWTPGTPFKNTYLLRALNYSCQSGIYEGYMERVEKKDKDGNVIIDPVTGKPFMTWEIVRNPDGTARGETGIAEDHKGYIQKYAMVFKNDPIVRNHFKDVNVSWSEATDENKDGSAWIIKNLTKSSEKMLDSRKLQFDMILKETFETLCNTLYEYFHDDNSDVEQKRQQEAAGRVNLILDALFGTDKYFFSDFISSFVVKEDDLHDVVLHTINDINTVQGVDLSYLFAIRDRAGVDPELQYDENVNKLLVAYKCETEAQLEKILSSFGITIEDIINPPKIRNYGRTIVEAITTYWVNNYLTVERFEEFVNRGLNAEALQSLLDNMAVLYNNTVDLTTKMADRIQPYMASIASMDSITDMIADICAEMINKFVNTVGAAYYNDETWNDVITNVEHNSFRINVNRNEFDSIVLDEENMNSNLGTVFSVFDNVDTLLNEVPVDTERLSYFSNYHSYVQWIEFMKIAFMATCGIPKYDRVMNDALRTILLDDIVKQSALSQYVQSNTNMSRLQNQQKA